MPHGIVNVRRLSPMVLAVVALTALLAASVGVASGTAPSFSPASCPDGPAPPAAFTDVPSSGTHAAAIDCVAFHGLTRGTTPLTYSPRRPVTRGQLATMVAELVRVGGGTLTSAYDYFDDDEDSVHEAAINALAHAKILHGSSQRRVSPAATVTRAQLAAVLVRAYEHITPYPMTVFDDHFVDDEDSPLEVEINKARGARFAFGVTDTRFVPNRGVRRDEMAGFLANALLPFSVEGAYRNSFRD